MKNILFIFFLMLATYCYSQNDEAFVDSLVAQKMAELEMQANPEYFFRKDYCEGNIQMFTMPDGNLCTSKSTYYAVYVFWKKDENTFNFQKFDNCGRYMPITISLKKQMEKLLKNKESFKKENVKPYEGEKVDAAAFENMSVSNCVKEFKFVLEGAIIEKSFKEFDLTNDSKYKNIHFEYNNSLALIEFDKKISEMIKYMEENGKFFREK